MYIGLDLGTSAMKALLVDDQQNLIAAASLSIATAHPHAGWAEQDPLLWIDAAKRVLADLRESAPIAYRSARGIGLSGQMHSLVVLDRSHSPIRPAILWNDVRGEAWCQKMIAERPELTVITGIRPMPSFTAAKLAWLKEHEPHNFANIAHVLLPKDFVRLWLTGAVATDPSDAGGTQMFDQGRRVWSSVASSILGIESSFLAPIIDGDAIAGNLRIEIASELGLATIPVICGGGDAATSSIGTGCVEAGSSMLSLGTGAVYLSVQDEYRNIANESVHNFAHCLPDRWYHMAALLNCGSALEWACKVTGGRKASDMLSEIEQVHSAPSPVLFLPYLDGIRTPHCNSEVRGGFFGLERATSPNQLVQAVIEGVTFALADADDALKSSDDTVDCPLVIGGGAKSRFWTKLIATVFQRPLRRVIEAETGSALGATRLAMVGVGAASIGDIAIAPASELIEPDTDKMQQYQDRLATFRAMYKATESYANLTPE